MSASFFGETGPVDIPKGYLPREARPVIIFQAVRPVPSPIGVISLTPRTSSENTGKGRVRTEAAQNGAAAGHSILRIGTKPFKFLGYRKEAGI